MLITLFYKHVKSSYYKVGLNRTNNQFLQMPCQ